MKESNKAQPDYGNWVSKKLILAPGLIGLVLLALAFLSPFWLIGALPFLVIAGYFASARRLFSPQGGDVQGRIRGLLLDRLDWDGRGQVLDIGCGSGALAVALAHKYAKARVTGIDYWGGNWEYSQGVCEKNAWAEGVADRITFQKGSASALPFEDDTFDAAVTNLVFHEVAGAADKRELVREALRVVRKGGKFAFQDLFYLKPVYGEIDDLLTTIRSWGISNVEFIETRKAPFIPGALKLPFMVGTLGLIVGEK